MEVAVQTVTCGSERQRRNIHRFPDDQQFSLLPSTAYRQANFYNLEEFHHSLTSLPHIHQNMAT
jgi:hypothetical protein